MDAALRRGRVSLARLLTFLTIAAVLGSFGDRIVPGVRAQGPLNPVGANFVLDAGDLRFIFHAIEIAQDHSARLATDANASPFGTGPNQVPEVRLPFGLRTVDGSFNHLESNNTEFGASDNVFPRLATPEFRPVPGDAIGYAKTNGTVTDAAPRIISNLVVDQTTSNPAAQGVVDAGFGEQLGAADCPAGSSPRCLDTFFIANVAPDTGLSAPFNVMFTFFGQFFDHGLDLVNKGGSGTVVIPLQPDDPLFVPGGQLNFMVLTRGTNLAGPNNILGDADDIHEGTNQTSPFVDQNQTYTSHPSHQVFLREYERIGTVTRSTGRMIDSTINGAGGFIGTWGDVKLRAAQRLGIQLTDQDVFNVPLLDTDLYGFFRRGPLRQLPRIVTGSGLVEGNTGAPVLIPANAVRTGHAFLDDIAHSANPFGDNDNDPTNAPGPRQPDGDGVAGIDDGINATYDDELLNLHFVTGDGRGNENIALTAVHTIFHSEHNRLRNNIDCLINGPNAANGNACTASIVTAAERTAWLAAPGPSGWDYGERLFQAAKFVTEMQYQHLVFEEFARKLVPSINAFIGDGINFVSNINPAIVAEFAHQTYRLGHSMLTETISRVAQDGEQYDIPLLTGFLNPLAFTRGAAGEPLNAAQAAGAVWRGGVRQVGNEIDEFVTEAVRNNLVGLPLDLPVLNLARGREQGIPPLNIVREQLFNASGDPQLRPYANWEQFRNNIKHAESLVNFIAAYGTGDTTLAAATTLAAKRARALFLSTNTTYLQAAAATTGVNNIDLWIGGLAEKIPPFGGMLGSTFTYVFEHQLENLQNADRFYYLERLDGLNLLAQLEGNSFTELIQRNTTLNGDASAGIFDRPDLIFNLAAQTDPTGIVDDPSTPDVDETLELTRLTNGTIRYGGAAHVIWNGRDVATAGQGDRVESSEGDDTLRGNAGNDVMEGGAGNDQHLGGAGDDILTDAFGEDVMKGGPGNDAIFGGAGPFDLLQGNEGNDFIVGGNDETEVFGGPGNDIIYVGDGLSESLGGDGDDWLEGSVSPASILIGDENNQFQDDPNEGNDIMIAGLGDTDFDSEGGDDVMVSSVLPTHRLEGMLGFDWVTYRGDTHPVDADMRIRVVLPPNLNELRDRFDLTEALSGFNQADLLRGDDRAGTAAGDPELSMAGHELTAAKVNALWVNPSDTGGASTNTLSTFLSAFGVTLPFSGGNILLGGGGADLIEGRGGDDLIDGNAWLNVQLRAPTATGFRRVNSLHALRTDVFNGVLPVGSISYVRTIELAVDNPALVQDVALFSGPVANYTISGPVNGVFTVTDNVGLDGTDKLRNIEVFRFPNGDGTFTNVTPNPNNAPPAGTPVLSQLNPQQGEALSVSTAGITDPNSPGGIAAAAFSFQWQDLQVGETGFANIPGATLQTFTPDDDQVGGTIRAIVSFTDGAGTRESLTSAASGIVGALFNGGAANDVFTVQGQVAVNALGDIGGTAGRDLVTGGAGNDTLITLAQDDQVQGGPGNDIIDTGGGADLAAGGAGDDTINTGAGNDTIRFNGAEGFDAVNGGNGTDAIVVAGANAIIGLSSLANVETITGAGAGVNIVGSDAANTFDFTLVTLTLIDRIQGGGGADIITGTAIADRIDGQAGADTLNGADGPDDLNGDAGGDTINGGPGGDTITGGAGNDILRGENGADQINGGADNDDITGGNGNDTLNGGAGLNVFRFGLGFGADTINGFDADAVGGQDLLNVSAVGGLSAASIGPAGRIRITGGANAVITIRNAANTADEGTITLVGVPAAQVTAADFTF